MPAKSTSPESAQKRVWKAELADLTKAEKSAIRDCKKEIARLEKERAKIIRLALITTIKIDKSKSQVRKSTERELTTINRRTSILRGRLNG
jgi:hypothetical protein